MRILMAIAGMVGFLLIYFGFRVALKTTNDWIHLVSAVMVHVGIFLMMCCGLTSLLYT